MRSPQPCFCSKALKYFLECFYSNRGGALLHRRLWGHTALLCRASPAATGAVAMRFVLQKCMGVVVKALVKKRSLGYIS